MTDKLQNTAFASEPQNLPKLQSLAKKNKKLLQSISTHLINNPDEFESKLYEHRFLQQKYNELIGFSRDNVDKFEKSQHQIAIKDAQISRLKKQLIQNRDAQRKREREIQRQYEVRLNRKDQELNQCRQELTKTKQEVMSLQRQSKVLSCKILQIYEPEIADLKETVNRFKRQQIQNTETFRQLERDKHQREKKISDYEYKIQELEATIIKLNEQKNNQAKDLLKKDKKGELQELIKGIHHVKTNIH